MLLRAITSVFTFFSFCFFADREFILIVIQNPMDWWRSLWVIISFQFENFLLWFYELFYTWDLFSLNSLFLYSILLSMEISITLTLPSLFLIIWNLYLTLICALIHEECFTNSVGSSFWLIHLSSLKLEINICIQFITCWLLIKWMPKPKM